MTTLSKLRITMLRIIVAGLLSACSLIPTAPISTETPAVKPTATRPVATSIPATTTPEAPTPSPGTSPESEVEKVAVLGDLSPLVSIRASNEDDWQEARFGDTLGVGNELLTDANGRARVLFSEGTVLRLAPNTQITVTDHRQAASQNWLTRLNLWVGQLWLLTQGDQAQVETPLGVASVQGSLLSVIYLPGDANSSTDDILIALCLEGQCSLSNDLGEVLLTNGQKAIVRGGGQPVLGPDCMTLEEVNDWLANNPEIESALKAADPTGELGLIPSLVAVCTSNLLTQTPGGSTIPTAVPAAARQWPSGPDDPGQFFLLIGSVLSVAGWWWFQRRRS